MDVLTGSDDVNFYRSQQAGETVNEMPKLKTKEDTAYAMTRWLDEKAKDAPWSGQSK